MGDRLTAKQTSIAAFTQAYQRYQPSKGIIFHSDRGVQYACNEFRKLLNKSNAIQSMSGKGNCYDNTVAESFFHTLKTELTYHLVYQSGWQARSSIFEYIEIFYNRFRKNSTLGYRFPVEYEIQFLKKAV